MDEFKIKKQIISFIQNIQAEYPDNPDCNLPLTQSPVGFSKIDLVYLFLQVKKMYPEIIFCSDDLENGEFNSVAGITKLIYRDKSARGKL